MSLLRALSKPIARAASGAAVSSRGLATQALRVEERFPPYVLNAPATEVTTLSNGVRVASEGAHCDTATVGVFIDAGSRYESPETNGTAHFLEHMTFKGTSKLSRTQFEMEIENMGGHLNAYTSREHTVFYMKVFRSDVPRALELLSDMLTTPKLELADIEVERDVILREMKEVNSMPEELALDLLHETAYQNIGLGRTILGPEANIRKISRDDITRYIQTHYTGPRVVVAGAGGVDHGELVKLTDKLFGKLPQSAPNPALRKTEPAKFTGSLIAHRDDDIATAHVALAFETGGWGSPHAVPLMVIHTLLSSWDRSMAAGPNMASQLCRKVAEENIAHSVSTFNTSYADTGLFGVYSVSEPTSLWQLTNTILYEMVRLCHQPTEEEVARARTQLKTSLLGNLDGTTQVCEDIGRQLLTYGRRITPAEIFARIDAVDPNAIKAAARTFFNDKEVAVAGVGNVHELPDINWLRRRTSWLRI